APLQLPPVRRSRRRCRALQARVSNNPLAVSRGISNAAITPNRDQSPRSSRLCRLAPMFPGGSFGSVLCLCSYMRNGVHSSVVDQFGDRDATFPCRRIKQKEPAALLEYRGITQLVDGSIGGAPD